MPYQGYIDMLRQGSDVWNAWRRERIQNPRPDLSNANLQGIDLRGADLSGVDFRKANLKEANLSGAELSIGIFNYTGEFLPEETVGYETNMSGADLSGAQLIRANLSNADLSGAILKGVDLSWAYLNRAIIRRADLTEADLSGANLMQARLTGADLRRANLSRAQLNSTDLSGAALGKTIVESTTFGNVDLSMVKELETVEHKGPSTIGIDTIIRSQGKIPEKFLRNAGLPDSIIELIPALVGSLSSIDYYTCFISYSSKDKDFAERLYTDLRREGVRSWFAPEDMKIGDKVRPRIEDSIRIYDKLLLVLSEYSITSNWVAYEVERALNKEPEGIPNVLFPIRLDDAVMKSQAGWANEIRRTRYIGDFTRWKNHADYQKAFIRLLRDLKTEQPRRL